MSVRPCLRRGHALIAGRRFYYPPPLGGIPSIWTPTSGLDPTSSEKSADDAHNLLLKAGFLRQAYSGVYHLLPLGLRVQEKLERLIDEYMGGMGASKLSLSSISSESLWAKSERLQNSELLRLLDRKKSGLLLSPTHEEEITNLVAGLVNSYKDLPLRLYQIGRKYRDELRSRGGLLRTKEFLMKDLYTFDHTPKDALSTYVEVKEQYHGIFSELKIPYLEADADSGNMGGTLSHEFHFLSPKGEDTLITCTTPDCEWAINEELIESKLNHSYSKPQNTGSNATEALQERLKSVECPECRTKGSLVPQRAIEVGHTFNLGTLYSEKLDLLVAGPDDKQVPVHMGCHGIGVSRLIGAVAAVLSDDKGLNWPRAIAPAEILVLCGDSEHEDAARDVKKVMETLRFDNDGEKLDVVADVRQKGLGWKLKDADLIGYPVVVVMGRGWKKGRVEVQCRRLGVKKEVDLENAEELVGDCLEEL